MIFLIILGIAQIWDSQILLQVDIINPLNIATLIMIIKTL